MPDTNKPLKTEQPDTRRQLVGIFLTALAAFFFAWQSPVTKLLMAEGVQALDIITGLSITAALIMNLFFVVSGRAPKVYREAKDNVLTLIICGAAKFGVNIGLFFALKTMSAGVMSVIYFTAPAFVVIFFMITRLKKVSAINKVAVVLTILGCMLALDVFNTPLSELSVSGILLGLFAAMCCATYTITVDFRARDMNYLTVMGMSVTVSAILGIIINPTLFIRVPEFTLAAIGLLIFQAVVTKIISITTEFQGLIRIGAAKGTVVLAMEVPFTLLVAYITLGETMIPIQLLGVALVVASVILLQRAK